jgi:acyl-CoA synthetase (AMP-forming)/AMP-acid ligase II
MMFNTGDMARWREDGFLEMLGRKDDQIKIKVSPSTLRMYTSNLYRVSGWSLMGLLVLSR